MNPASEPRESHAIIRFEIPARAEWVAVARLGVAMVASRLPFTVEEVEDIRLAIAESCTNAIQHGPDGAIEIVCDAHLDRLVVTVRDRGTGPRLGSVEEDRITEHGRTEELGVFLIRSLMDHVDYTADPRTGTELVMTKHIAR
jgi:serine/threonine-protein kinase RsbW